ncbi:sulfatase-like hydrolase/transferase [Christiangramia flava]|uniref:Arylsulfatase n=1 Tax=Christiangramia flava JLT2011 TaxID=1229726 RepID=A0A1L7I3H5_9FLAO|nr:sulfatase-like hydrolase/transferase [Christiangramia flava]APU68150.1 Arylsulfatase [Christiangramia flava JLT2011]OSS41064.1 Arylsulfatase [Christiangramia flava JLT2011]
MKVSLTKSGSVINLAILAILFGLLGCKNSLTDAENISSNSRPNIILIIADDAGWNDVGYHGSEIKTPNIDSLAINGIQLNHFYAYPTCSPSRASLLTGIPASRMGIVAPISGKSEISLADTIHTLPKVLKGEGYVTALLGKWHLGLRPESGPGAYGFDYSYGFLHGQIDQYAHTYKNGDSSWHENGSFIDEEGHVTDLLGKAAMKYIQQKSADSIPFFLQLAYSAPHIPLQEPEKWKEMYRDVILDSSRLDYAAAMTHMDHSIGEILKVIGETGIADNTIIIFMSDNGAQESWYPNTQYNGKYGPNATLGSNYPFRGFKMSNYEGGIRVPAIVYWKNKLSPGTNNNYISVIDIMPSILNVAGTNKNVPYVEGRNMWNAIAENKNTNDFIYVRGHLQESIIKNSWKLIRTRYLNDSSELELYNLEKDPEESDEKFVDEPELVSELQKLLQDQFKQDAEEVNVGLEN